MDFYPLMIWINRKLSRQNAGKHYCLRFLPICLLLTCVSLIYYSFAFPYSANDSIFLYLGIFEISNHINGTLFLIPFLCAVFILSWREAVVVWFISFAIAIPRMHYLLFGISGWLNNIAYAVAPVALLVVINLSIEWRKKEKRLLIEREEERASYLEQVLKAQESERQRIARELHDEVLQELLGIANKTRHLIVDESLEGVPTKFLIEGEYIQNSIFAISQELRNMSLNLRPSILDNFGLVPAVRWLADRIYKEEGIHTEVIISGEIRIMGDNEVIVYRLIQEALNNIKKHSKAKKALIALRFRSDSINLTIQDDGKGFPVPAKLAALSEEKKLGLIDMHQRAQLLGGTLKIISEINEGTTLVFELKC